MGRPDRADPVAPGFAHPPRFRRRQARGLQEGCVRARQGDRGALLDHPGRCLVVSMPCMELFEEQDDAYKAEVLPKKAITTVFEAKGITVDGLVAKVAA